MNYKIQPDSKGDRIAVTAMMLLNAVFLEYNYVGIKLIQITIYSQLYSLQEAQEFSLQVQRDHKQSKCRSTSNF